VKRGREGGRYRLIKLHYLYNSPTKDCNYIFIPNSSGSKLENRCSCPDNLHGRVMFLSKDKRVPCFLDVPEESSGNDG
jgi:hypothetical protein